MPLHVSGRRLTALVLLAASLPAIAGPLPIGYFTRDDTVGTLRISPEGDFLAATTSIQGTSALVFFELDGMKVVGGARAVDGDRITRVRWVSNSRVVYFFAERARGKAYATETGEIFAIDRNGEAYVQLYGARAGDGRTGTRVSRRDSTNAAGRLLSPLWSDENAVLITEHPFRVTPRYLAGNPDAHARVARLDVHTGRTTTLGSVPLASADVVVDSRDQVRFAMGYDENSSYAAIWKPEPGADWKRFGLPGFQDDSIIARRFTEDNRGVLFTARAEEESLNGLYRLDLETGTAELLYRHEEVDIDDVVTDLDDETVIGVTVYTDKLEYHWLETEHPAARLHQMLQRAFPGRSIRLASIDRHGHRAIIFVYSDVNPGDYYLFDTETRNASFLQSSHEWVDPGLMRPKEPIALEARDGLRLHGYLTRPHDGAGPYPLVVLPHGGPHGIRDGWGYDWEVQLLANRGYAVLQVNFRGSHGYGSDFKEAGYGEWGTGMQDDLTDATHWAIDQGIAENGRICIFGSSYGGYAALMGMVREPGLYRCAIGQAGVYDLELLFEEGDLHRWETTRAAITRYVGNDTELLRERSPVYHAERIETPVLLIHGREDWRADYEHAARMKKALERANKPLEWLALSGEGHGVADQETREDVYERILAFLDVHLPVEDRGGQSAASAD